MLKCKTEFYTPHYQNDSSIPLYRSNITCSMEEIFKELTNKEFALVDITEEEADTVITMQKPNLLTRRRIIVESISKEDLKEFKSLMETLKIALSTSGITDVVIYSGTKQLKIKIGRS